MNQPRPLTTERVDDIPLLLAQLEHMGVQSLLNEHFPTHGNWQGLSLVTVAVIWLSRILSQGDHRPERILALLNLPEFICSGLVPESENSP